MVYLVFRGRAARLRVARLRVEHKKALRERLLLETTAAVVIQKGEAV